MFSNNQLTSLPDVFDGLTLLTKLHLSCVSLFACPLRCVRVAIVVVVVVFSNNQLVSVPDSFGSLVQLVELYLEYVLAGFTVSHRRVVLYARASWAQRQPADASAQFVQQSHTDIRAALGVRDSVLFVVVSRMALTRRHRRHVQRQPIDVTA